METAAQDKSIQMTLFEYFADVEQFSLKDAKECVYQYAEKDVKEPSIRARIYEGINKGLNGLPKASIRLRRKMQRMRILPACSYREMDVI